MKKYVVCGDCGRKLCKAEPGSVVELVCPKCKKPVVAMVKEDGIVMFDQSIKSSYYHPKQSDRAKSSLPDKSPHGARD